MGIEITEVRVSLRDDVKLKAFASITLADLFVIRGLKIIEGTKNRLFVAMPSRKRPDGKHQDIAHPITRRMREYLENVVLSEYQRELERSRAPRYATSVRR
jgi:stage V sporulation protein G